MNSAAPRGTVHRTVGDDWQQKIYWHSLFCNLQTTRPRASHPSSTTLSSILAAKQQKIEQSMAFASRAVFQSKVDQKIITFFVDNMLPLEVVDSATFGSLLKTLQPAINVMSRRSLTRKIEERFHQATEDLKALLANVQSVATTADVWSCRNRSYLGMTVHWIDPTTMKRKRSVLACRRLLGRHTFDILAKTMETVHMEFRIENKVKKTTTDNGSNFVKAFRLFGDEDIDNSQKEANEGDENEDITEIVNIADVLEAESGEQSGNEMYVLPQHQRCAAHTLNLVATSDAEKAMTSSSSYKKIYRSAFAKARELWNKQCRSTQAADVIKMELGKMLVVPTATRWNSVYDSVTCLVTVFDKKTTELNRVCNSLKLPLFTLGDMRFLKEYILVLKPVAVSLDILQGEEKAFMGLLVPVINVCVQKLKASKDKNFCYCAPLVDALLMGIQTRFSNQLEDLDCIIASAFHPQFKLTWCKDESELREIRQKMISLVDGKRSDTITQATSSSSDDEENADSFFNELQKIRNHSHVNEGDRLVNNYLESPLSTALPAPKSFPCNPFFEIFVEYNTPTPSSAVVERMFSLGKDIQKPKRSSLSDVHFEMLVF